jgi:hypothetical protein
MRASRCLRWTLIRDAVHANAARLLAPAQALRGHSTPPSSPGRHDEPHQLQRRTTSVAIRSSGKDTIDAAELDGFAGHSEDDAARFILCDVEGAGGLHFPHPPGSVISHTGEDDADGVAAGVARGGAEQHVHRWTVTGYARPAPAPVALNQEVSCACLSRVPLGQWSSGVWLASLINHGDLRSEDRFMRGLRQCEHSARV